ncbi:MAG: aldehyde dehydrogenase, partial [Myxococcota bacterium]
MAYLSEDKIAAIVEQVVAKLQQDPTPARAEVQPPYGCDPRRSMRPEAPVASRTQHTERGEAGVFVDLDAAVAAAREAFVRYVAMGLEARYRVIAAMREETSRHVETLARMAVEETGLGRVDQKIIKNRLVIAKTPGPEVLKTSARTGDDGLTLQEWAPFGVIGAITPTTNPTETVICNAIGMLAAGNAVVFNAHPGAKRVSAFTVQFLNKAIVGAGGPENLVCCTKEPPIELAQQLMRHPGVRLLVVTGGPGVVKEAMTSGKKVIAAGPGNPPVVVDESADLEQAAEGIVKGVSFDNNIVCTAEKEIIAVAAIADRLKELMARFGAYELSQEELARLEKVVIDGQGPNKNWVGKDATDR